MKSWFKLIGRVSALVIFPFLLAGCSGELATLGRVSPTARITTDLFFFVFWFAAAVFVITEGVLLYSVFRFRRKKADEIPVQVHGNNMMELGWTVVPSLIVVVLFIFTVQAMNTLAAAPPGTLNVKVIGHQWWWEYQYPDLGVVTANELHIPVGQTVNLQLETKDVIHSFWFPRLSGKTDLVPGRTNTMPLRADEAGVYLGQCAEFCGTNHANMRMRVFAQTQADFDAWVKQMKTAPAASTGDAAKGKAVFEAGLCIGCHAIEGTKGVGVVGPNLTHFGGRSTLAAGVLENNATNLARWLKNPDDIKPGTVMGSALKAKPLTQDEINALVAYLSSLK